MNYKNLFTPSAYWRKLLFYMNKAMIFSTLLLPKLNKKIVHAAHKGFLEEKILAFCMDQTTLVPPPDSKLHNNSSSISKDGGFLRLHVLNWVTHFRADTFYTKEPETLEWLDSLQEDSVLWDIGANVGLYSLYAAKTKNINVYAFEPSVFNLELLTRNIFTNKLDHKITIIPVALSDKTACSNFALGNTQYGGACSCFDKNVGFDGKALQTNFQYRLFGMSGDDVLASGAVPAPDYIKMDVDGIEHYILSGMQHVLKNEKLKSVIIEGNDDFKEQVEHITMIMQQCGFTLESKRRSELIEWSEPFTKSYNQLWTRKV